MKLDTYLKTNVPRAVKKGHFTKAYLYYKTNQALLESRCYIKECMALGWFPNHSLFPSITFSELESSKAEFKVYEMPLYSTSRSVKSIICKEDYEGIYLPLRRVSMVINYRDFEKQLNSVGVSEEVRNVILEAYEACMNYGQDIGWEISPRNVAATEGRLVLLDCFYIKSQLNF